MWKYECVMREEFELIKDKIEEYIVRLGGNKAYFNMPYIQRTVSYSGTDIIESISTRPAFEYNKLYYRVDEVCFSNKPFIVIECGTYEKLMNNTMEDAEPFPYDLTDDELLNEVRYSLGIEPYPKD